MLVVEFDARSPLSSSCITFRAITRQSPTWLNEVLGEHQEDITSLDDSEWGTGRITSNNVACKLITDYAQPTELSRTLQGANLQGEPRIDFSVIVEGISFGITPFICLGVVADTKAASNIHLTPAGLLGIAGEHRFEKYNLLTHNNLS